MGFSHSRRLRMRLSPLIGILITLLLALPLSSEAYLLADDAPAGSTTRLVATPYYFEFNAVQIPVEAFPLTLVFVGDPPESLPLSSVERAIEAAIAPWNAVACSYATLQYGGTRDADSLQSQEVPIRFVEAEGFFENLYGWASVVGTDVPEHLAIWLNRDRFRWALDARPFDSPPQVDLVAVLTHEIGHILGLAHSTAHGNATMWGGYLSDGSQRTLSADDKVGLCSRYPTEQNECRSDGDCPDGPCARQGDFQVCDTWRGQSGDYCGLELQHCQDFCAVVEESIGVGYCSVYCSANSDCPPEFSCARGPEPDDRRICRWTPTPNEAVPEWACSSSSQTPPPVCLLLLVLAIFALRRREAR